MQLYILLFIALISCASQGDEVGRQHFMKIVTQDNIHVDMRYFSSNNFTLEVVDGYRANICMLEKNVARALRRAANSLKTKGYGLYIFDCYRPQKGVDHFVRWAQSPEQPQSKMRYYPNLAKKNLFDLGYIAKKSGHSRGSTVDLSLYRLQQSPVQPVDMGTPFDFFSKKSHTDNASISESAKMNRKMLKQAMESAGFENYSKEWWHYTFKPEPFPTTYFNFDVSE